MGSYSGSTVHGGLEPHGLVGAGTGFRPPSFAGNVCRIGGDAGFPGLHVTEDPDGVSGAALVWINPELT